MRPVDLPITDQPIFLSLLVTALIALEQCKRVSKHGTWHLTLPYSGVADDATYHQLHINAVPVCCKYSLRGSFCPLNGSGPAIAGGVKAAARDFVGQVSFSTLRLKAWPPIVNSQKIICASNSAIFFTTFFCIGVLSTKGPPVTVCSGLNVGSWRLGAILSQQRLAFRPLVWPGVRSENPTHHGACIHQLIA